MGSARLERVVVRDLPRAGGHARVLEQRVERERGHVSVCEGTEAARVKQARRRAERVRAGQPVRGDITRSTRSGSKRNNLDQDRRNAESEGAGAASSRTWNGLGSARSSKGLSAMIASVSSGQVEREPWSAPLSGRFSRERGARSPRKRMKRIKMQPTAKIVTVINP